ncbi:hypothetical protein XAC3810_260036 [Xanthomonas citri pv. citri]|uniref:Uncharacterized protein n=1 Tax=Xanthomonas citri pv. citri TaxID=611301 RepID=A0A0U5FBM8_XANCI|nr:hypothetical protein XAC3824_260052 [Xanthomonas citri pv. citri]CEE21812.1 hypothetical protein XAC9322_260040 [Xanthomonas citri pv. citri]CEE23507.1 hypothetical protein XAC1083_260017 [Xanthomonas citri pv. citri]CEE31801.1 hypothetical protein XAC3810_260036 [Xanthomonas citri pv. citri]CEE34164.1 hypothetical protein XAC902_320050 [Xanthomonas citri pv. citri]
MRCAASAGANGLLSTARAGCAPVRRAASRLPFAAAGLASDSDRFFVLMAVRAAWWRLPRTPIAARAVAHRRASHHLVAAAAIVP